MTGKAGVVGQAREVRNGAAWPVVPFSPASVTRAVERVLHDEVDQHSAPEGEEWEVPEGESGSPSSARA